MFRHKLFPPVVDSFVDNYVDNNLTLAVTGRKGRILTFYCNDHTITKFGIIDRKNSSTAYVILY